MSFVCVSVFSSFFRFLVKYFQLHIVTSLLPFVVNKAYHFVCAYKWSDCACGACSRTAVSLHLTPLPMRRMCSRAESRALPCLTDDTTVIRC